jgi:Carboxypeptidase regulatory-like domain/TonB dependent receptor-like, beta-barrel
MSKRLLVVLLLGISQPLAFAKEADIFQAGQQPATGRVIATVSTLEGTVMMPGVQVELRTSSDATVLAKTTTDGAGQVAFPGVPPGRYLIQAMRPGFVAKDSAAFEVRAGETARVLVDIQLVFVLPEIEVRAETPSPTDSVQPVSMSDMLAGSVFETVPLEGDDFQSLLLLLPGVVRGPDGRLRVKGGQPSQGALQMSSASLNDPSTGDFDLEVPSQSVESVEVLANPFAAEYGRFSTSITQIRTRQGTNEWKIAPDNFLPRFRSSFAGIKAFEPRFSARGPIKRDRTFLAQDFQLRYVNTPVKSLLDEPEIELRSFDSFTRVDTVVSARHTISGALIAFPRKINHITMNTFRPPDTSPDFNQSGWSTGIVDRLALARDLVLETTVSARWFEVNVNTEGRLPMVYAPQTQSGSFFNDQERSVHSLQWVEALSWAGDWHGSHVFKIGTDLQRSAFNGFSESRPIEVRRLDGSLAELTMFGPRAEQDVSGIEFAGFVQDRWRLNSRLSFELGFRVDRDAIVEHFNFSPRAGVAIGVAPEGRAILRGGYGKFVQRTPLNVEAFPLFESRTVTRFGTNGTPLGPPVTFVNTISDLHTPDANVGNIEWDQRFGRRLLFKLEFLRRSGYDEFIVVPDPAAGELRLTSSGVSSYRELEATTRFMGGARRDLTVSYVWARGTADLNNYDQFFGNLRTPIIRSNENNLIPTDVRHRLLVRGTFGIMGKWDVAPVLEIRSGFPWSAVNEFQDFVGERNRAGRLPVVRTLDFTITRPFRFKGQRVRAGLKFHNILGASADRDVQNNLASPDFGSFFNPIERSFGFAIDLAR